MKDKKYYLRLKEFEYSEVIDYEVIECYIKSFKYPIYLIYYSLEDDEQGKYYSADMDDIFDFEHDAYVAAVDKFKNIISSKKNTISEIEKNRDKLKEEFLNNTKEKGYAWLLMNKVDGINNNIKEIENIDIDSKPLARRYAEMNVNTELFGTVHINKGLENE